MVSERLLLFFIKIFLIATERKFLVVTAISTLFFICYNDEFERKNILSCSLFSFAAFAFVQNLLNIYSDNFFSYVIQFFHILQKKSFILLTFFYQSNAVSFKYLCTFQLNYHRIHIDISCWYVFNFVVTRYALCFFRALFSRYC